MRSRCTLVALALTTLSLVSACADRRPPAVELELDGHDAGDASDEPEPDAGQVDVDAEVDAGADAADGDVTPEPAPPATTDPYVPFCRLDSGVVIGCGLQSRYDHGDSYVVWGDEVVLDADGVKIPGTVRHNCVPLHPEPCVVGGWCQVLTQPPGATPTIEYGRCQ